MADEEYSQRAFWFFLLSPKRILKFRSRIFVHFINNLSINPRSKILDLGVTETELNYFHQLYKYKKNITAILGERGLTLL